MSNTPENNKCQYHFMGPTCEINDHALVSVDELDPLFVSSYFPLVCDAMHRIGETELLMQWYIKHIGAYSIVLACCNGVSTT